MRLIDNRQLQGKFMDGARKIAPLQVRCPPELREWLKAQAAENRRSLNSEIVARLEASRAATGTQQLAK
jgi:predicted HicB family RNase H-like nuclease